MNKKEYEEYVLSTATHVLNICQAQEAIDAKKTYEEWYEEQEYSGLVSNALDSQFDADWKKSVSLLDVTNTNPDDIDFGGYDNTGWKQTLVSLAYRCWEQDVYRVLQELYNGQDWDAGISETPDTYTQLGFFPNNKTFRIPCGEGGKDVVGIVLGVVYSRHIASDFVKVRSTSNGFTLVFEGSIHRNTARYVDVTCKRVYTQGGASIVEHMAFAKERLGVREIKPRKPKKSKS